MNQKSQFNFDLERIEKAVNAPSHVMPSNLSGEEYFLWLKKIASKSELDAQFIVDASKSSCRSGVA